MVYIVYPVYNSMPQQLISAKVPPEWADDLKEIAASQKQTVSDLLRSIVGNYLGKSTASTASTLADRIAAIEARVDALESSTRSTELTRATVERSTPSTVAPSEEVTQSTASTELDDGEGWLLQSELCDRYGLSYQNLATRARENGGMENYLKQSTGLEWLVKKEGRSKMFKPLVPETVGTKSDLKRKKS